MSGPIDPFLYTSGPRHTGGILLVGEAWGEAELRERRPFVGYSGKELDRILFDAGLNRGDVLCTNLVDGHPTGNNFTEYLEPNSNKGAGTCRGIHPRSMLTAGLSKLTTLISTVKPKLIIGCGNWPLWALTPHAKVRTDKGYKLPGGIMSWRGSQTYTELIDGNKYPFLPIIHPAAITRDWSLRHITCQDLRARAKRFITGSTNWAPPAHSFEYSGHFGTARDTLTNWINLCDRAGEAGYLLCCDIETWKRRYLAVVGLADANHAIAIPFFYFDAEGKMVHVYSLDQEHELLLLIRRLLCHPKVRITNQNYAYDWQFLYRYLGITTPPAFDTMLAHHLLWPGTPKSLDYLASLYCDHYIYWKDESQDWDAKGNHMDMWLYNCKDTRSTYEITEVLTGLLKQTGMKDLFEFQLEQWELANEMGRRGVNWDRNFASQMRLELIETATRLSDWLMSCMPQDLQFAPSGKPWFASNTHLQYIFYDRLGISPILHKKTKRPTLDKESFEQIKKRAPFTGPILDKLKLLRSVQVFRDNFLSKRLGPDQRMHPSFNVGGTETFRWSSSENAFDEGMNLQNIPKLDEE